MWSVSYGYNTLESDEKQNQLEGNAVFLFQVYPSEVNVISLVDISGLENICNSTELCGGT